MKRFFDQIKPWLGILTTLGLVIVTNQPSLFSSQRVLASSIPLRSHCALGCSSTNLLAQTASTKTVLEQPLFLHLILIFCSGITTGLWLNSRRKLTKVRRKNRDLRQQLETLDSQILDLETLETQVSQLREEIERKDQYASELQQNLERLKSLNEEYNIEVYEAENKSLRKEITSLNQAKKQLETEYHELETKNCELFDTYEKLLDTCEKETDGIQEQISSLTQEKIDLENGKNWLQEEKKRLEHKILEILQQQSQRDKNQQIARENLDFNSLEEVLNAAEEDFEILRVWDTAKKSAEKESHQHYDFPGIYRALKAIAEIGELAFKCKNHGLEIGHPWKEEFERRGVTNYKPHESHATMRQYGNQRQFYHDGEKQEMTQHLTFRNRDQAIQIFFIKNEDLQTMDIGYCGKHLDYDSNHT